QIMFLISYTILTSLIPFIVTIFLRRLTIRLARTLNHSMSQSTQQMHIILVKTLNTQLVLAAFFFVGCSCFLVDLIDLPFLRNTTILSIPLSNLQNVCTPIANLIIITPYRRKITQSCQGRTLAPSLAGTQS
ncbi:hypothetical protein PENTCL1PPCAC_14396, partial [Pristionchus entomophagus]